MIPSRLLVVFLVAALAVLTGGSLAAAQEVVTVAACTGDAIELTSNEKRMLDLHNETRAGYGLPPLCVHPALTWAARAHSQEMLDGGYFSHDSPYGESIEDRLERFGYTSAGYAYWTYGENLGWGSGTLAAPESRFDEWMGSPDHRDNILREDLTEVGIGTSTGNYGSYGDTTMYTVDFGSRY
jgi:uncharacterized protein YkwD